MNRSPLSSFSQDNATATESIPAEAVATDSTRQSRPRIISVEPDLSGFKIHNDEAKRPEVTDGDLFDLSRLRLSQNFADTVGVKKALLTVPVRKPDRQSFVRVRDDAAFRLEVATLHLKEDQEIFLVDPVLATLGGVASVIAMFRSKANSKPTLMVGRRLLGPGWKSILSKLTRCNEFFKCMPTATA